MKFFGFYSKILYVNIIHYFLNTVNIFCDNNSHNPVKKSGCFVMFKTYLMGEGND